MSQLAGAAASWYVHCFQVKRYDRGFYERGVYRRIQPKVTEHRGNVQPASRRDIQRLPEASRSDGAVTVYSRGEFRTAAPPNQVADRIVWQGVEYEVGSVERWASHNKYVCQKVGQ